MSTTKNHALNAGGKRRTAFTLAEVLITLVIIGVIAAATIPTLLQKHQEQEMITRLRKAHSILSNAYAQAIRENGPIDEWDIGTKAGGAEEAEKHFNYLKTYLKIQKECGTSRGCFASFYKPLFPSNTASPWSSVDTDGDRYKFILQDGTSVGLWSGGDYCRQYSSCGSIILDLNNKKGPNRVGVDMFSFDMKKSNIVPSGIKQTKLIGADGRQCNYNVSHNYNGMYCSMHVLMKGNMDYLHKDVSDDWKNYP